MKTPQMLLMVTALLVSVAHAGDGEFIIQLMDPRTAADAGLTRHNEQLIVYAVTEKSTERRFGHVFFSPKTRQDIEDANNAILDADNRINLLEGKRNKEKQFPGKKKVLDLNDFGEPEPVRRRRPDVSERRNAYRAEAQLKQAYASVTLKGSSRSLREIWSGTEVSSVDKGDVIAFSIQDAGTKSLNVTL